MELDLLARRTRGLRQLDIIERVEHYVRSGELPKELAHPTNTCDPFTGNWDEHLMDPFELLVRLARHGFTGKVLPGYYPRYGRWSKHAFTGALNVLIAQTGTWSLRLAPHYILYARNC